MHEFEVFVAQYGDFSNLGGAMAPWMFFVLFRFVLLVGLVCVGMLWLAYKLGIQRQFILRDLFTIASYFGLVVIIYIFLFSW